jgi:nitrite reductase/ring-hydroxylating ferredoxin subunit
MYAPKPEIATFLDGFEEALAEGKVPVQAFNDADLHALELDRIFTRAWVFVGHESEVLARGDYVQRRIGRDPFVVARGEDGEIRVLFDACRHRGAMVCRAERGNAALFRCPYHGWTYKNTGQLVGAPFLKDAYGTDLDKSKMGLFRAPQVESLHGLVFASLDPEAPGLTEYLGDLKWHFDMAWGQCEQGWEVVGEPQRVVVDANWKSAAENFSGDDYHTMYLHRSTIETGIMPSPDGAAADPSQWLSGYHVQLGNGHSIAPVVVPPDTPAPGFFGYPDEVSRMFSPRLQGPEHYEFARRALGFVGVMFPNFGFISFPFQFRRELDPQPIMAVRVFEPRGPGEIVIWAWTLCPKGVSEEFRRNTYLTAMGTFSAGGTFEQDDTDPWIAIARSAGSTFGRKVGMKLDYTMGLRGAASSRVVDHYPGPGLAHFPSLEEGAMRGFHRRWLDFMRAESYPPAMTPQRQNDGAA